MLRRNDPLADRSSSVTKVQSLSSRIRANATIQRTSGLRMAHGLLRASLNHTTGEPAKLVRQMADRAGVEA